MVGNWQRFEVGTVVFTAARRDLAEGCLGSQLGYGSTSSSRRTSTSESRHTVINVV